MSHFIGQSFSVPKETGEASDLTLWKHPFLLSSKTELPEMPPSFLNGSFLAQKVLSHRKTYRKKPNSQPWFTPESAVAIVLCNHYYNLYHREQCCRTFVAFRTAHNHYKRVLEDKKSSYSHSQSKPRLRTKDLVPVNFRKSKIKFSREAKHQCQLL